MTLHEQPLPLVSERREQILSFLHRDGRVLSGKLSREFGTSEDTIRRDLREMASAGLLRRVHGGALPCGPATTPLSTRLNESAAVKRAIAGAAVELIRNGQVVILDAGSSAVEVARRLRLGLQATVFTNSPAAAVEMSSHDAVEVMMIGGSLDREAGSTWGAAALESLSRLQADVCLMGVCGLDPEIGFTASRYEEAAVKRMMIERSADVVALASADKLGTAGPHVVGDAAGFTHLITDEGANPRLLADFENLGIQVVQAGL